MIVMRKRDIINISLFGILAWLVAIGGGYAIWQAVK